MTKRREQLLTFDGTAERHAEILRRLLGAEVGDRPPLAPKVGDVIHWLVDVSCVGCRRHVADVRHWVSGGERTTVVRYDAGPGEGPDEIAQAVLFLEPPERVRQIHAWCARCGPLMPLRVDRLRDEAARVMLDERSRRTMHLKPRRVVAGMNER